MSVVVITPPEPLLTAEDAAKHLRLDTGEEADYLEGLIAAAQGSIDGPPGWLGRSLGEQVLELRVPCFEGFTGGGIVFPCGPVIAVESVAYVAVGGAVTVLDPSAYCLDGGDGLARVDTGVMWPSVQLRHDAVRVRYRAGYPKTGDGKSTVPANALHAMKVIVGLLWEHRTEAADLQTHPTIASLLSPLRAWGC